LRIEFFGTRGSIAAPGPETVRYGGNTSCVLVEDDGDYVILDAGTGLRRVTAALPPETKAVHLLLSHLHMDHLQGLGFFGMLRRPDLEFHLWGPAGCSETLGRRLSRYLSPPLFPVRLRDLECRVHLHEVPRGRFDVGRLEIDADYVIHPGPTVGYRVEGPGGTMAYLPDHEPALGNPSFPGRPEWTSGYDLCAGVDVLVHDGQYSHEERATRVGWGHSALAETMRFAEICGVRHLVPFHHDPARTDEALDTLVAQAIAEVRPRFQVTPAAEGQAIRAR
jgi:ribonuclease BN (tRNA processing enzyme)